MGPWINSQILDTQGYAVFFMKITQMKSLKTIEFTKENFAFMIIFS